MKNKTEKIELIHSLKKEEDIHKLLEELLPEMDFKDVIVTHERGNRPEDGKDLICSFYDKIEDSNEVLSKILDNIIWKCTRKFNL